MNYYSARALFVVGQPNIIRFSEMYPDLINSGVDVILTTLEAIAAADSHSH
jgi:alkyl hydroperoxide reductase subunit AhpC